MGYDADSYVNPIEILDTTTSTNSAGCLMLYGGLTIFNTATNSPFSDRILQTSKAELICSV